MPIHCEICKKELLMITPAHLKKHQLTVKEYKKLYPNSIISSCERNALLSVTQLGRKSWNKGLTKETNISMFESSEKHKGQLPWNTGLTKETDERVARMSESVQKSVQLYFDNGGNTWLKGLTKETDSRVRKLADNLIGHKITEEQRQKCSIGVSNAWKRGDFSHVRPMGSGYESIYHKNKKEFIVTKLNELGYKAMSERFIWINGKSYAVDVFARNKKETIIIEVGGCDKLKENIL